MAVPAKTIRRHRWRRWLIPTAAGALFMLMVALLTLIRTPNWYRPVRVEPQDRQRVRNNLVAAEQAFTAALLQTSEPFVYHLHRDDLNRWASLRNEFLPFVTDELPPEWVDPYFEFDNGLITIGARYCGGPCHVIVSLDIEARFEAGAVLLRVADLRCGSLPLPRGLDSLPFARRIEMGPDEAWPGSPKMSGNLIDGLRIDARAWWKNGGMDYEILDAVVTQRSIDLTVQSRGRHVHAERSVQAFGDD